MAESLVFVLANAVLAVVLSDFDNRRFTMPWWVIETDHQHRPDRAGVGLGPFIKRFGRAYAAECSAPTREPARATSCSPTSPTT